MLLIRGLCFLVLALLGNLCLFLPVKDQLKGQLLMHQSQDTRVSFNHKISYMHLSLSVLLLFHIVLSMFFSTPILILQMLACIEACIFLILPVSICSGNSLFPRMNVNPS